MTDKGRQTVLIVDDQAAIRRQLASVLEDDYEVIQASSRKEDRKSVV